MSEKQTTQSKQIVSLFQGFLGNELLADSMSSAIEQLARRAAL